MAYYPTNFYSSYPQQQFPQYQYQQQNNLYTGLQGKVVDSVDMDIIHNMKNIKI